MAAMEKDCASMGTACVAQDGTELPVKSGMWSRGKLLRKRMQRQAVKVRTKKEQTRKVNHRLLQLVVAVQQRKQQQPRQHRKWAWVLLVEKVELARGTESATRLRESATAIQASMEFCATSNIVKAGTVRWVQIALAIGFVIQETVSVLLVGGKTQMIQTRRLQMCARTRFAQSVVVTMACALQVLVSVSRVGQDQTARILIVGHSSVVAMGNVPLFRRIPLDNACAITDGVVVHANEQRCILKCGNVPTTAVAMVCVWMANVSAMLALMDQTAPVRSVQILRRLGPGVICPGVTTIALARACA
jgi:hypothetical protein